MKQDLRYAHLVASPFQRSRRRKTKGDPPGGMGDEGWTIKHTHSHTRKDGRARLPRPPSSKVSFLHSSSSSSSFLPSPFFLLFNKHQIRTVNGKHLSAHMKNHRRWCPHSHIHRTQSLKRERVYLFMPARVSRAHFGSRSRNSVTVQRCSSVSRFFCLSLSLTLSSSSSGGCVSPGDISDFQRMLVR